MPPSPQIENGYLRIATELVEALARVNLSAYESRVVWFVIGRTYGFNKKIDRISFSQFADGTGIKEQNVVRTIKSLTARRLLTVEKETAYRRSYGLQKDYSRWLQTLSIERDSTKRDSLERESLEIKNPLTTERENPLSPERYNRQKTYTKDNGAAGAAFDRAWSLYPKRAGENPKKKAFAAWTARLRSGVAPAELMAGVERYAKYIHATGKERTEYVKQAATFFGPNEHWREPWEIPADRTAQAGGRNSRGFAP